MSKNEVLIRPVLSVRLLGDYDGYVFCRFQDFVRIVDAGDFLSLLLIPVISFATSNDSMRNLGYNGFDWLKNWSTQRPLIRLEQSKSLPCFLAENVLKAYKPLCALLHNLGLRGNKNRLRYLRHSKLRKRARLPVRLLGSPRSKPPRTSVSRFSHLQQREILRS